MEANNMAAMREALVKAKKAICDHAEHICQSLSCENSNIQSNCGDVLCAHRELCEAKTAINAALSAPPRNCDRLKTGKEAKYRFLQIAELPEGNGDADMREWYRKLIEWLFSPVGEGAAS